ncbi:SpoIIE family protein phosphatase [Conexibacter sp. SYSU D00693]|uniref:SpoIIE family protein phosphatase n=1 Tax=Conexibacter sp. SYSU D00693 TaxID=2812560 RepID=UPI00196AF816|nr:SpoIIE family protein phosphatase [Conexibacter sp. SYSU D00693]
MGRQTSELLQGRRTALAGFGLVLLAVVADLVVGPDLVPLLVVGPLVAAARARTLQVVALSVTAVLAALALGFGRDVESDSEQLVDLVAVAVVGVLAVAVSRARDRLEERQHEQGLRLEEERSARRRAELLSRLAEVVDAPLEAQDRLAHLADLPVGELADLVVVDLVDEHGQPTRAITRSREPGVAERVAAMRSRIPLDRRGEHPAVRVLRTGEPLLIEAMSDEQRLRWAAGPEHAELMRELGYRSAVLVPLRAVGRVTGVLTCLRLGDERPAYTPEDLDLLAAFAERTAISFRNADLFIALRAAERRLDAILANVGEAVVALAPDGTLAFANRTAAELFGAGGPAELEGRRLRDLAPPFAMVDEQGERLHEADLPHVAALRGEEPEPVVAGTFTTGAGERWFLVRAAPVRDETGAVSLVVAVAEDVTAVKRAQRRQQLLASASGLLSSSLDVDATLDRAAWAAVPELADWSRVDLVDERGQLREAAVAHRVPAKLDLLLEWRRRWPPDPSDTRGASHALRTGEPVVWASVRPEDIDFYAQDEDHAANMRAIDTRSVIMVPLVAGDRAIGVLQLATTGDSGRLLGDEDVELAMELARRTAVAVEHARLHAARSHVASTLQRSLLPPRLPKVPGLETAARFRAAGLASEVGGDFYDMFAADGRWMVVMGDVTGKGPGAAAITSMARFTLRTAALYEPRPADVLARLNAVLLADGDRRQICTAVCVSVEPRDDGAAIAVACAGHPSPYVVAPDGTVRAVGPPGTLLGGFEDVRLREEELLLAPGEALVLFTDGVPDARGADERFGHERVEAVLRATGSTDPDELAAALDDALLAFEVGPQRDDVALLVLRATPGSR